MLYQNYLINPPEPTTEGRSLDCRLTVSNASAHSLRGTHSMDEPSIVQYLIQCLTTGPPDESEAPQPAVEWFVDASAQHRHHVSIKSIERHADRSYEGWMELDHRISDSCNLKANVLEWLTNTPVAEVERRLDEPLIGCAATARHPAWEFTPHQRLAMVLWIEPPVDAQVQSTIDTTTLHDMAQYATWDTTNRRQQPITSVFARRKGVCPDVTILDLPTSGGKTALSMAMALLRLSPRRFDDLVQTTQLKQGGTIFQGTCELKVARLCIVASGGSTFDHFQETLTRLIPAFEARHPGQKVVVWTTMGMRHNVRAAFEMAADGQTVVFWCVPTTKMNTVLRQDPTVSVACVITDEYTTDPPRERSRTTKSPILHHLLLQATPQSLVSATEGYKSWFSEIMGGKLLAPRSVARLVKNRKWTEAQLALDQSCKLRLMTMTFLREGVRQDLRPMMPNGMDVYTVRSRRVTLSSHLLDSQVDFVPMNFPNVLLSLLRGLMLTDASIRAIRSLCERPFSLHDLVSVLHALTSTDEGTRPPETPLLQRLLTRIHEACDQCPVCFGGGVGSMGAGCAGGGACSSSAAGTRPMIYGCCGYIVCDQCFAMVNRCPFCRTQVDEALPRSMVPEPAEALAPGAPEVINLDSEDEDDASGASWPLLPRPRFQPGTGVDEDVARLTSPNKTQVDNLTNVLHILHARDFLRVVVVVESESTQLVSRHVDNYLSLHNLETTTGFKVHRVDTLLNGKGSKFASVKREFDDPSSPPQVLFCHGIHPSFLYGTDLARATALVAVGDIGSTVLTQAMGRVFRALKGRSTDVPVKVFKIYTGASNLRRRQREQLDDGSDEDDDE